MDAAARVCTPASQLLHDAAHSMFVVHSHAGLQAMHLVVYGHVVAGLDIPLLGVCGLKVCACWRWEAATQKQQTHQELVLI